MTVPPPSRPRPRKAVIPAAGLGTRFLPATKAMPKEMLPVVDRPAIEYVVSEARRAGLADVLMITGRNKRALEDHFDRHPALEAALERVSMLVGARVDWSAIETFLPEGSERLRRSALASSFLAVLELARQGKVELRQAEPFAPLLIRQPA